MPRRPHHKFGMRGISGSGRPREPAVGRWMGKQPKPPKFEFSRVRELEKKLARAEASAKPDAISKAIAGNLKRQIKSTLKIKHQQLEELKPRMGSEEWHKLSDALQELEEKYSA